MANETEANHTFNDILKLARIRCIRQRTDAPSSKRKRSSGIANLSGGPGDEFFGRPRVRHAVGVDPRALGIELGPLHPIELAGLVRVAGQTKFTPRERA